jgi:hypothetical protein
MTNVRAVRVDKLDATPAFTLADLMGVSAEPNADEVFGDKPAVDFKAELDKQA